jgi:hypothetical protein
MSLEQHETRAWFFNSSMEVQRHKVNGGVLTTSLDLQDPSGFVGGIDTLTSSPKALKILAYYKTMERLWHAVRCSLQVSVHFALLHLRNPELVSSFTASVETRNGTVFRSTHCR